MAANNKLTVDDYNNGVAKWDSLSSNGVTGHLLTLLKTLGNLAGNLGNLLKLVK